MLHKIVAVLTAFMLAALVSVSSNKGFGSIHGVVKFVQNDEAPVAASAILQAQDTGFCKLG